MAMSRIVVSTEDGPIVCDVQRDRVGNPSLKFPTGGWWGALRSNSLYPFILLPDGRMDFGADPDDDAEQTDNRYGISNILRDRIGIGTKIYVEYQDDVYEGSVVKIENLEDPNPSQQ